MLAWSVCRNLKNGPCFCEEQLLFSTEIPSLLISRSIFRNCSKRRSISSTSRILKQVSSKSMTPIHILFLRFSRRLWMIRSTMKICSHVFGSFQVACMSNTSKSSSKEILSFFPRLIEGNIFQLCHRLRIEHTKCQDCWEGWSSQFRQRESIFWMLRYSSWDSFFLDRGGHSSCQDCWTSVPVVWSLLFRNFCWNTKWLFRNLSSCSSNFQYWSKYHDKLCNSERFTSEYWLVPFPPK